MLRSRKFQIISGISSIIIVIILLIFLRKKQIIQPINFSHKKHTSQGIACEYCHEYYNNNTFAGIPGVKKCMECHESAVVENSSEEEKIRVFAKKNIEIPWQRLFYVPDDVYYSHQRHVGIAKLDCKTCHGNIAISNHPFYFRKKIKMDFCIDCHKTRHVTIDCISCHR
jgi:predicted CXXCH cytochrome family protein